MSTTLVTLLALLASASGCTNFHYDVNNETIIGRTMELGQSELAPLWTFVAHPRGSVRRPENRLGFVSIDIAPPETVLGGIPTASDGMNEAGLTISVQVLQQSEYEDARAADVGDARARDAMLSRPLFVARELTKVHEQHWRGTVGAALAALDAGDGSLPARGEFTLVLGPRGVGVAAATGASEARIGDAIVDERIEALRKAGEPTKRLARTVAAEFGLRRSDVYARAVALSNST